MAAHLKICSWCVLLVKRSQANYFAELHRVVIESKPTSTCAHSRARSKHSAFGSDAKNVVPLEQFLPKPLSFIP